MTNSVNTSDIFAFSDTITCNESKMCFVNFTSQNITTIFHNTSSKSGVVPVTPTYILISVTILYAATFLVGVLGNILVGIVIKFSRNMRSSVNMYLVNLCVADILVLIVCMPTVLVELHTKEVWYFGELMCKMVPFLEAVVASSSVFTIIAISIERFRVVCKPLSITRDSPRLTAKILVFIWIFAISMSAPLFYIVIFKSSYLKDGTAIKVCRMYVNSEWKRWYLLSNAIVTYLIPLILIFCIYIFLCKKLIHKSKSTLVLYDRNIEEKTRLRRQVIQIIATVVCVFFLGHLPYRVVSLWWIFQDKMKIAALGLEKNLLILYFSRLFLYLNHALNPILYNLVSTKFRVSCCYLIRTGFRQRSSSRSYDRHMNHSSKVKTCGKNHHISAKNEIRLSKIKENSKSSGSCSDRQYLNDFSIMYRKNGDKNVRESLNCENDDEIQNHHTASTDDKVSVCGHCKNQNTDTGKITTVRLVFDSKGQILAIKLKSKQANDIGVEEL